MRYLLLGFALICLVVVSLAGFRGSLSRRPPIEVFPDMDRQPKFSPQHPNAFFANGFSSQLPVAGAIARGAPYEDVPVNTGLMSGTTNFVETNPLPVTVELLKRGQERFQITCAPCHGAAGDGKGITTKYGMAVIRNLQEPLAVKMPDGQLFHTITYGFNLMGPYGAQVAIEDRWAIVAYVRALQRSRLASLEDVPEPQRAALKK